MDAAGDVQSGPTPPSDTASWISFTLCNQTESYNTQTTFGPCVMDAAGDVQSGIPSLPVTR
jgi:hypothetical protein